MSWALYLAVLLPLAACITAHSDPTDQRLREGKDASFHDSSEQLDVPHLQLGSGAGSDPNFHGNENNEPATSSGHPHSRSWTATSTSREHREVVVTVRKLQDISYNGIFGKITKVLSFANNYLLQSDIPLFYAALWPISVMLTLVLACMRPGDGHGGGHNRDQPPAYDPANSRYNLRSWLTDLNLWICQTTRPLHSQAAAIVQQLQGTARIIGRQISVPELMNGGEVNGQWVDPVSYVVLALHNQFAQLETENQIIATNEYMAFHRRSNESINEVLARYEVVRHRAAEEGNFTMDITGCCMQIFRALHIDTARIVQLLRPFGGTFPQTEEQFQAMLSQMRVEGRILENLPGNIGQSIQQGNRQAHPNSYLVQPESQAPFHLFTSGQGEGEMYDCGELRADTQGTSSQSTFLAHTADRVQSSFPAIAFDAPNLPQAEEGTVWDQFSSGTDTDTSSDDYNDEYDDEDLQGLNDDEKFERLYFQKSFAKRRFRRFTGKPVRKVRRFYKRRGESWAKQGKGRGKGRRTFMFGDYSKSALVQESNAFLANSYQANTSTSGKGFGRKGGNPIGPDGKKRKCFECGSEDHLKAQCPKLNGGTLLTKSHLFQKGKSKGKSKSKKTFLSDFIQSSATGVAAASSSYTATHSEAPVSLFSGLVTEYQGPFSAESLAKADPPSTATHFAKPIFMTNDSNFDPWASAAGSLRLTNAIGCPRRARSHSPNRSTAVPNPDDLLGGITSLDPGFTSPRTEGLWGAFNTGQASMPERPRQRVANTLASAWVPQVPQLDLQATTALRAPSPPRSPRTHPYGSDPDATGVSPSGPSGQGASSSAQAPQGGLPMNLFMPLNDVVNNVQAPKASALITQLVAGMGQQQIQGPKISASSPMPGFGIPYDPTNQASRMFGTPAAPPMPSAGSSQPSVLNNQQVSVPMASPTASQGGSSRSGRRSVAAPKRQSRNEEQIANATTIFSNLQTVLYRTPTEDDGPRTAKLAGHQIPLYMRNPHLLAKNARGNVPSSAIQSLVNNPHAPKRNRITRPAGWAEEQLAHLAAVNQVRLQNTHKERDYMLNNVLPNIYSAPTGYHEMNQFTLQDGDELDEAISEGDGSDRGSQRSATPPAKAAPMTGAGPAAAAGTTQSQPLAKRPPPPRSTTLSHTYPAQAPPRGDTAFMLEAQIARTSQENSQLTEQVRMLTESLSELRVSNIRMHGRLDSLTSTTADTSAPTSQYLGDNTDCPLCLYPFRQGEYVIRLGCAHCFHKECWDRQGPVPPTGRVCPCCRSPAARIRAMWTWVRTNVDTQLLPDGTQVENLLPDSDVDMEPASHDVDAQSSFDLQQFNNAGPFSIDNSGTSGTALPASTSDTTGPGWNHFADVFGMRTGNTINVNTAAQAELMALQQMQVMSQVSQQQAEALRISAGLTTLATDSLLVVQNNQSSFGPWQQIPESANTSSEPYQPPVDSATGPAGTVQENFNMSPVTTPRVEYTALGVPVIDLVADEVPVIDLTEDLTEALPASPATEVDAAILADDWLHGRNRFAVSQSQSSVSRTPRMRTSEEFMISETGTQTHARYAPGITTVPGLGSITDPTPRPRGPVIDTGSVFNVCGERWARELAQQASEHNQSTTWCTRHSSRAPQFSGIGHGTRKAILDVSLPTAMESADGQRRTGTYEAPCLQDSDIPGVIGLKALEENGALLDIAHNKLYFVGQGYCNLIAHLPPGTECFDLHKSSSGHLVLPTDHYFKDRETALSVAASLASTKSVNKTSETTKPTTAGLGGNVTSSQSSSSQVHSEQPASSRQSPNIANVQSNDRQKGKERKDKEDAHLVSQLSSSLDDPDIAQVTVETAKYLAAEHKRLQREARERDAYSAFGVAPPSTGSTGSVGKGKGTKAGKTAKHAKQTRSSGTEDPDEVCWNCGRTITDAQGKQIIYWTTMFVSESSMSKRPCCSIECLTECCAGKPGFPIKEAQIKREQISKRTQSAPSSAGQSYSTNLPAEGAAAQQVRKMLGTEMSREGEAGPSEEEYNKPIATLHPDGTHSMGTVRDLPDQANIRWRFNDQGARYPTWCNESHSDPCPSDCYDSE